MCFPTDAPPVPETGPAARYAVLLNNVSLPVGTELMLSDFTGTGSTHVPLEGELGTRMTNGRLAWGERKTIQQVEDVSAGPHKK